MPSAAALLRTIQESDESTSIEAKRTGTSTHSVLETVCAFANEPDLGGGYLLLGVEEDDASPFPGYRVKGINDPDKLQSDLASQCATMFNIPIRPVVRIEKVEDKLVAVVEVKELAAGQKPLFFEKEGLPRGAYRRIGPTDQRCTEDDLVVFYTDRDTYDSNPVDYTSLADIEPRALTTYRSLRSEVKSTAEELRYGDLELLQALGCIEPAPPHRLTVAGVLLFGTSKILRREFPMMRVDYIRVPGTRWVEDVDDTFLTIDFRESLVTVLPRIVNAIQADIPKTFSLKEGDLQAQYKRLPDRVLREVVTNALMHRTYRKHGAVQIIRYDNRLEIKNPGFSLKPEEQLGTPGSETRNPKIAAVFHETDLAETKGSGIKRVRRLLKDAGLDLPTFESNRTDDSFTARLLLHHLLGQDDIAWLASLSALDLDDRQRRALVFLREVGALDRSSYQQFTGCTTSEASAGLRGLAVNDVVKKKGSGRGTYYVPGPALLAATANKTPSTENDGIASDSIGSKGSSIGLGANSIGLPTNSIGSDANSIGFGTKSSVELLELNRILVDEAEDLTPERVRGLRFPDQVEQLLEDLPAKPKREELERVILRCCSHYALPLYAIAVLLGRNAVYVRNTYLKPMIERGDLVYVFPEMPNHPKQAYWTKSRDT